MHKHLLENSIPKDKIREKIEDEKINISGLEVVAVEDLEELLEGKQKTKHLYFYKCFVERTRFELAPSVLETGMQPITPTPHVKKLYNKFT